MISIQNLYKIYQHNKENEVCALKEVSLQIVDGEMVAVVGTSGSGKSTLLHCIGGLERFESGTIAFDDCMLHSLNDKKLAYFRNSVVGIVLQDFALIPEYTAFENVAIPLQFCKKKQTKIKERINNVLALVGMQEYANKKVNQLSGGQKQRVAIARALVNNPKYILADEPTGALDTVTSREIVDLLLEINKRGTTVVIVTHDMEVASRCQRIIRIEDGMLVE